MNENLNCPYCYSEHIFVKKTLDVTEFKCGRCGLIISGDSQADDFCAHHQSAKWTKEK